MNKNVKHNTPRRRKRRLKPFWRIFFPTVLCIGLFSICVNLTSGKHVTVPTDSDSTVVDYSSRHEEAKKQYDQKERAKESSILVDISKLEQEKRKEEEANFNNTPYDDTHKAENTFQFVDTPTYNWTEDEINTLVLAVQHEVGTNPGYYPNCEDFDYLQRCMARVIVNRVGTPGFGESLKEVLNQKHQFTGLLEDIAHYWDIPNSEQYNPYHERTRANVMAVLNDEDGISHDLYFERCSLRGQSSIYEAWEYAKSLFLADTLELEYYEETADGRFIMFIVNPNGAY